VALLLALAVHAAVIGIIWICGRRVDSRVEPAAVELAWKPVEISVEGPPPSRSAAAAPARPPRGDFAPAGWPPRRQKRGGKAIPEEEARAAARRAIAAVTRPETVPPGQAESTAAAPARAAAATPSPALPAAPALSAQALRPSPSAPAPKDAPPAGVDLRLRRDPLALESAPVEVRPGQVIETPTLSGKVGRDGSLSIRDKGSVALGSDLFSSRELMKKWMADPRGPSGDHDGTVQLFRGKFDITDSIMRAAGQDPYRAERMKMLDATREQRLALAARDRGERQQQQLVGLPASLRQIWNDVSRSARERRGLLFQLWDECQEAAEGEEQSASAGASARRMILAFIRTRARAGTADGYSPQELAALNRARQSRQRFEPYLASGL
jgi:hypothetical protein